jgi:tRNA (guanine37-N1)-methyltransferase
MIELAGVHPKIKMVREDDDCAVSREGGGRSRTYGGGEDDASSNDSMGARKMRKRILLDSGLARGRVIDDASDDVPSSRDDDNDDDDDGDGDGDSKEGSLSVLARRLPGVPYHVLRRLVYDHDAMPGRVEIVRVSYQNQPISRILSKVLPHGEDDDDDDDDDGASRRQPPPSSYEQIGHVAHFNLRGTHVPYGRVIGRVMLDRLRPTIRTVVNKVGEVGGPYRTYDMDLLAGDDDYFVRVIEHGAVLEFDLRNVYWCTRLEGERTHMIRNVFRPKQLIADAFCGVGALCIRARVELGCDIVANDLNPDAASYCAGSARRNGIRVGGGADDDDDDDDGRFRVRCGDAREFIMNLGIGVTSAKSANPPASSIGGVEDDDDDDIVAPTVKLPDHLLLNFPLDSPKFLNALRWWPSGGDRIDSPPTRVHVYTFSRGDDERNAMDVAIDMVADGLLPEGGYVEPTKFRGGYLDELGCNVHAREIRDAAPGKSVICVSFSVTRLLLRRMQGDYGLI